MSTTNIVIKRDLHTRIDIKYYNKLLLYGKGSIKQGIINLIEIADKKRVTIKITNDINLINDIEYLNNNE